MRDLAIKPRNRLGDFRRRANQTSIFQFHVGVAVLSQSPSTRLVPFKSRYHEFWKLDQVTRGTYRAAAAIRSTLFASNSMLSVSLPDYHIYLIFD